MKHDEKKQGFDANEFPALQEFLSAYLHQDFGEEYDSAAGAVNRPDVTVAVGESENQQLRGLLKQMPGCTQKQFMGAAQSRGIPRQRAKSFLDDGVDLGTVVRERGTHNRFFHTLSDTIQ